MKNRWLFAGVWTCVFTLIIYGFARVYSERTDQYVNERLEVLESSIDATVETLGSFSGYVFESVVLTEPVLSIMSAASSADADQRTELRSELYQHMLPHYTRMQDYRFRQLHFHLPDTTSFLRMHSRHRFGDYLGTIRSSIRITNSRLVPIQGFEEGRIFNGYRFVYPLLHNDEHVGSAEVSFSINAFIAVLSSLTDSRYLFTMNRSIVRSTVFWEHLDNYSDSFIDDSLLFDGSVPSPPELAVLFKPYDSMLQRQLRTGHSFGYFTRTEGVSYLVLFHAVMNVSNRQVGYMIAISKDDTLSISRRDQLFTFGLLSAGFLIIQVLSWIVVGDRQQLLYLVRTDQLTGIRNRHYLQEEAVIEIDQAHRYGHAVSLILFDIDFFKQINDTYGHNEGDTVLKNLANVVSALLRTSDRFARWGGEEFVVLLSYCNSTAAFQAAEKIRQEIAAAHLTPHQSVTVSLGVAELQEAETLDALVGRADKALYRAKESGRNCTRSAEKGQQ